MKLPIFGTTLFAVFLVIAGCSSTNTLPAELLEKSESTLADEYRIGVDDQIQITVWGNDALSVNMPVRPDGKVSMPLIGDVNAGGLTSEEMSEQIRLRLSEYVRNPNVTVQITELRSHEYLSRVRITGAVQIQISIPYRQGMTILDAVLAAGGVTEYAAPARTMLQRSTLEGTKVYEIDLNRILNKGDIRGNVELAPGDTITVPQRAF
jgi:polysaccharide export outer membrane protein